MNHVQFSVALPTSGNKFWHIDHLLNHTLILFYVQKLTRRTSALELVKWTDHHEKGRAAEVLVMDAMSSEDSCYEDDENGNAKVANFE